MKPQPREAMSRLINEVRCKIPFHLPESTLCLGPCLGCSKKLLEYLDIELSDWQAKLEEGVEPKLGDIQKLAKTSKKIYLTLIRNGFLVQT